MCVEGLARPFFSRVSISDADTRLPSRLYPRTPRSAWASISPRTWLPRTTDGPKIRYVPSPGTRVYLQLTSWAPQGLSADEMRAYQGNLCDPEDPAPAALASPSFFDFDIAAVGLGFHHFDDPTLAARRLVERLKPGGVLLVLDFLPHGHVVSLPLSLLPVMAKKSPLECITIPRTPGINTLLEANERIPDTARCFAHGHAPRLLQGGDPEDL